MATPDDDPTRAAVRVAESVVSLMHAEVDLALVHARASAGRVAVTLAIAAAAVFAIALAIVVLVFSPLLWELAPAAAIGTVSMALSFAIATSTAAIIRFRRRGKPWAGGEPLLPSVQALGERDHAVPR